MMDNAESSTLFNIQKDYRKKDEKQSFSFFKNVSTLGFFEKVIKRFEKQIIILNHDIFNEVEAAIYLRLPDPEGKGRETIRNYALRSRELSFIKIGRKGLTFLRSDLNAFLSRRRTECAKDYI